MPWNVAIQGFRPQIQPQQQYRHDRFIDIRRYTKKLRSALRTDILRHLGDSAAAVWTTAEVNGYIDEAYNNFCYSTKCLWMKSSPSALQDVAGQATYTLPSDLYQVERVTHDGQKLLPLNRYEAQHRAFTFESQQGDVEGYVVQDDGIRKLRKVLVPSSTYSGATSETFDQTYVSNKTSIEYTRRPTALSADTSTFEIPDFYLKYIRFYALSRALEREGPGQDLALAAHYQERFNDGVQRAIARRNAVHRMKVSRLGGAGRTYESKGRWRLPSNYPNPRY